MPTLSERITATGIRNARTELEDYCLRDLLIFGQSMLSLRSLDNAIFASQRVPITEFYGRSYADDLRGISPDFIIHDEIHFTLPKESPAMTEVTANTAAVTPSSDADIHVRPPLPEGIRYFQEGNDMLTITDVSGAPEAFHSADRHHSVGYVYQSYTGSQLSSGSSLRDPLDSAPAGGTSRLHRKREFLRTF